ncbi:MAG: hypothetical protein ACO24P_00180 [Candidatus Nanopelagicaceae bacterium]
MNNRQLEIATACEEIKNLLIQKNLSYGDSALNPTRVFSKASPIEQLFVRIDDKLSRIQKGSGLRYADEDVINDLIGYLVLLKIALKEQDSKQDQMMNNYFFPSACSEDVISFTTESNTKTSTDDQWDGTDVDSPFELYLGPQNDRTPD